MKIVTYRSEFEKKLLSHVVMRKMCVARLFNHLVAGYALKSLTELLASFLVEDNIKQQFKGRLVGAVLNGYLSLRRLVVQRTRLIDETQEKLLELLEEMTTGVYDFLERMSWRNVLEGNNRR